MHIVRRALRGLGTVGLLVAAGAACSGGDEGRSTGNLTGGDGGTSTGSVPGNGSGSGSGSGGFGLASSGDGGSNNGICENYEAVSAPRPPAILLLLDQSGSMNETATGGGTRWDAATNSIREATAALQDQAKFGLIGYPLQPVVDDTVVAQTCSAEVYVTPELGAASAIDGAIYGAVPTKGHTPIRSALLAARDELTKPAYADDPKYVILVTDGMPNCKPGASELWHVDNEIASVVQSLRSDGITTFVVGYDIADKPGQWSPPNDTYYAVDLADAMAQAGGTGQHRPVSSGAEFIEVLTDITHSVAPCSFELNEAPRGGAQYVRVTIDGTDYALNDPDGWTLEGDRIVALKEDGAACQLLRDGGTHNVQIQVECEPVVVR